MIDSGMASIMVPAKSTIPLLAAALWPDLFLCCAPFLEIIISKSVKVIAPAINPMPVGNNPPLWTDSPRSSNEAAPIRTPVPNAIMYPINFFRMGRNMAANAPSRTADPETAPQNAAFHTRTTPFSLYCLIISFLPALKTTIQNKIKKAEPRGFCFCSI